MRDGVKRIIIHCMGFPEGNFTQQQIDEINNRDIGFTEIDQMHKERGFGITDHGAEIHCGYNYVIRRNGVIELGRSESVYNGAQCRDGGHNFDSVGVVVVGGNKFTSAQFLSLRRLVGDLRARYGDIPADPHCLHNTNKTCPNFDVDEVLRP